MAVGDGGGFRTRAASLLRSPLRAPQYDEEPKSEPSPTAESMNEKYPLDELDRSLPPSSAEKASDLQSYLAVTDDIDTNRIVRTIPTWVHTFDEEAEDADPTTQIINRPPPNAEVAQHNSSPSSKTKHRTEPPRGRLHDSQREWAPPTPSAPVSEHASMWRAFANSSAYPVVAADGDGRELVTEEWLVQNGADYSRPWLAGSENGDVDNDGARLFKFRARRKSWWERLQRTILRSSIIPLVIRTNVWVFSLIALALGSSLHRQASKITDENLKIKSSSPNIAITVDAIALVYILYITYDEYTGKPLGLRSARAKMRLIFLDLFFIVFDSANLSLAFEAVSDSNSNCENSTTPGNTTLFQQDAKDFPRICHQERALASVLLIALISWILTFSISVFR
ncbi:hypothetical protein MMC29_008289 [Sticta canariensis]|nr:hypothetical protein [Sticta canariensis]